MTMADGSKQTVSACEKHVEWYVARGVMRWVERVEGQDGVLRHVDGELPTVRRCIA
jgi:hypothetical protein